MKQTAPINELAVEAIRDLRKNPSAHAVHADTYLNTLSEAEWTELRAIATRSRRTGNPVLRCGECGGGVYARESLKGRRHCYHFAGDHSDCPWSRAVAQHLDAIDAIKFHGQQESERHRVLSQLLAEVISLDIRTKEANVIFRRFTKHADGQYAYPDVYTDSWQGAAAAFEIQLSTTQMPVIVRREDFYERTNIRLSWIIGYETGTLDRRAFRDIYMRNDGQILGVDEEVAVVAREAEEPRFRLHRLLPKSRQDLSPVWRDRIVRPDEINWGDPGARPRSAGPSYDSYLDQIVSKDEVFSEQRQAFYRALETADDVHAGSAWNLVSQAVGGCKWNELPYDSIYALGVLATLRTETRCVPTRIPVRNAIELSNSMLLEPKQRRVWTPAFQRLCAGINFSGILSVPTVHRKCIRNVADLQPGAISIDRKAGFVFDVFFPEGAFNRLTLDD